MKNVNENNNNSIFMVATSLKEAYSIKKDFTKDGMDVSILEDGEVFVVRGVPAIDDKVELSWKERIVDTPDSEYKTQTEYYGPGKIGNQKFSWTFLMGDCTMDIQTEGKTDLTKCQGALVLEAFEDAVLGNDTYDHSADRAFFNDDYEVKDGVGYYNGHGKLNGNKFLFTMSEADGAISLGKDYGKDERKNIHQLIWDAAI